MSVAWGRYEEAYKAIYDKMEEVHQAVEAGSSPEGVGTPTSTATTDANDKTVKTPASGKKYHVKFIYVWNTAGADRTLTGFKFGSGSYHFAGKLSDKTGFAINLTATHWEGAADEALIVKADGAGVQVTVFGEEK